MSENVIKVGMADLKHTLHPGTLITLGLGSCVGVALYDTKTKIIGLAHIMLPWSHQARNRFNKAKFADTGIKLLLDNMIESGAHRDSIVAKLAGGAQMFAYTAVSDVIRVGERNVEATKKVLADFNIPVIAEDTGGRHGRTIEFYSEDGRLMIKTIGYGITYI
ncbi:MAG: chemotaxis protein CheD [Clostridiaceae bacterium]|nr:chemotaxis protein CheD [Clostridiaceae bacterium]